MTLHYLNGDTKIPIFCTDPREAVDIAYVVSLLVNEKFDCNVVCHKNQIKPKQNCFMIQKSSLNHQNIFFRKLR